MPDEAVHGALPPDRPAAAGVPIADVLLAAMAVGTYPLAWLPRGVAGRRFDLEVPWPGILAVAALVLLGLQRARSDHGARPLPSARSVPLPIVAALCLGALVATLAAGAPGLAAAGAVWLPLLVLALAGGSVMPIRSLRAWALPAPLAVGIAWLEVARGGEWVGTFGNWNFFGTYLALSLFVAGHELHGLIHGAHPHRDARRLWCAVWLCVAAASLVGLGLSRSRGAWAALVAAVAWYFGPARWSARRRLALVAAGLVAATAMTWIVRAPAGPWARAGTDVRPWIWSGAWAIAGELPLTGAGAGRFADYLPQLRPVQYMALPDAADVTLHAHNWPLQFLAEWGLLGAPLWILLLAAAFGGGRAAGAHGSAAAADEVRRVNEGALALVLVQNLVDVGMFLPPLNGLTWWLTASLLGGWPLSVGGARHAGGEHGAPVGETGAAGASGPQSRRGPLMLLAAGGLALALAWVSVVRPAVASHGYWRGQQATDRGDWAAAARGYERACRWSGAQRSAFYKLGFARSQAGDLPGAVSAYEQLAAISPGYAEVQANLTRLRLLERRPDLALPHAVAQVGLDPFDAGHWARLASCHLELGDVPAGVRALREALALDPQHGYARATLARLESEGKVPAPAAASEPGDVRGAP